MKVGIGGGSICITREQKGIGRGQASALMDVVAARERILQGNGHLHSGVLRRRTRQRHADHHRACHGRRLRDDGPLLRNDKRKPHAQGVHRRQVVQAVLGRRQQPRAQLAALQRRKAKAEFKFEEGVDGYVPVVGSLSDVLAVTIAKLKSTMCNSGAVTLPEFMKKAVLTRVSEQSFVEGGTSNIKTMDQEILK